MTRQILVGAATAALAAGALAVAAPALQAAPSQVLDTKSVDGAELFLRYTVAGGKPAKYTNLRLTVSFETFDQSISKLPLKGIAGTSYGAKPKLTLRNVNGDDGRDAIVDVKTVEGRTVSTIALSMNMTSWRPRPITVDWGVSGYRLKDLDHDKSQEFLTSDERFDDVLTGDVDSTFPIMIKKGGKNHLIDVTARFPEQIKAQVAEVRPVVDAGQASETTLATLIADLARLGDTDGAKAVVEAARKRGELTTKLAANLGAQLSYWGYVADPASIGLSD